VSSPGDPPGDRELAARIAAGEERAFVIAYDRHAHFVFGSVVRFLGDREAAAEVAQDAFVALWRRAGQFDAAAGSLLTWLLGIARNRAIDRLRAESRRPMRLAISLDAPTVDADGLDRPSQLETGRGPAADRLDALRPEAGPEAVVQRRWLQSLVRTAISELPESEQRALTLAYGGGLSQSEIAERLGWPLGTVKSRTRRGMAHLRARLVAVPGLVDEAELDDARTDSALRSGGAHRQGEP
jgi:RNA polymerase sigma-70 factor (ECF subfamily)